jgi:ABC-2 type transport system ATP-binding protein
VGREPIIRASGLTRRFGGLTAVDHLNLEITRGEILGLVGPDGAGKTTTLRMLCGLINPTEGEAVVAGHDVRKQPQLVKDRIGYMAQRFGLYADLTVSENMSFYADLFGVSETNRTTLFPDLLRMTRMDPFANRPAGKLSGGMKQKLGLMCSLLHRPEILFLDEPTNGVDPVSRRDFWVILHQLVKQGITVVITTAYLDEAERCDRVGLMDRGKLIQCDTPAALRTSLPQDCYEVEAADLRAARDVLRTAPGVVNVELAGGVLHMFAKPGETSVQSLEDYAQSQGRGIVKIRPIEPALEDVFISLVRQGDSR